MKLNEFDITDFRPGAKCDGDAIARRDTGICGVAVEVGLIRRMQAGQPKL